MKCLRRFSVIQVIVVVRASPQSDLLPVRLPYHHIFEIQQGLCHSKVNIFKEEAQMKKHLLVYSRWHLVKNQNTRGRGFMNTWPEWMKTSSSPRKIDTYLIPIGVGIVGQRVGQRPTTHWSINVPYEAEGK